MKKVKNNSLNQIIGAFFIILCIIVQGIRAKSNPIIPQDKLLAFKRAQSLDNGISVSWLEQTWNKDILNDSTLTAADFDLLKTLGFKSLRLPVAFEYLETNNIPFTDVCMRIDEVIKQCHVYGLKLIIDYHYGELNDNNYADETARAIHTWSLLAKKYKSESTDDVFYEIYNEPPHMNPAIWRNAAHNIIAAIRQIDKKRTLLVGASNFNSIYELSRSTLFTDDNIIYTFHFYEPFLFTHQGADWVGNQEATTGVTFPYNAEKFPDINPKAKGTPGEINYRKYKIDGNEQSLTDKLMIIKKWGAKYNVPIICGEYGVYNKYADQDSRCRYIKAMRAALKKLNIPGMMWDYNSTFSIFDGKPSLQTLPDCMKDAIGYTVKN